MGNDQCCNRPLKKEEGETNDWKEFSLLKTLNILSNGDQITNPASHIQTILPSEKEQQLQIEFQKNLPDLYKNLNYKSKRFQKLYRTKKKDNKEEFILKIIDYNESDALGEAITLTLETFTPKTKPIYKWRLDDLVGNADEPDRAVVKGWEKSAQSNFSLKFVSFMEHDSYEFKSALYQVYIMKQIQNFAGTQRNIQQFYDAYIVDHGVGKHKHLVMVLEHCDCNLDDIIKYRKLASLEWNENNLLKIYQDLVGAMAILHNLCIAHRDLRPENVWFSVADSQFKIGSFEGARLFAKKRIQALPQSSLPQNSAFLNFNQSFQSQSPIRNQTQNLSSLRPKNYSEFSQSLSLQQQQQRNISLNILNNMSLSQMNPPNSSQSQMEKEIQYKGLLQQAMNDQSMLNQSVTNQLQMSQHIKSLDFYNGSGMKLHELEPNMLLNTIRCKPAYMPPELLDKMKNTPTDQIISYNPFLADVYALAVIFFGMQTLETRPNLVHLQKLVNQTMEQEAKKGILFQLKLSKEVVGKMAIEDPSTRLLFSDIVHLFPKDKFIKTSNESQTVQILLAKNKAQISMVWKLLMKDKLASSYAALLQAPEAVALYKDLLEFFEINNDNENKAQTMLQMGTILALDGDLAESSKYFQLGLKVLLDLARGCRKMNNYEAAITFFEQALSVYRKPFMSNQTLEMTSILESIGNCYRCIGEFEQAKNYQEEAVQTLMKSKGKNSVEVAKALNNLGNVYACLGDYDKAEDKLIHCINLVKNFFPSEKKGLLAMSYSNLGEVYRFKGKLEMARKCLLDALVIEKELYGKTHPEVASTKENLGNVYYDMNDFQTAKRYYEKALILKRNHLGDFHPDLAISLNNLGNVYRSLQQHDKARVLYEEALEINRKNFGEMHPNFAASLGNLGLNMQDQGQNELAKKYLSQALQIILEKQGLQHPDYLLFKGYLEKLN